MKVQFNEKLMAMARKVQEESKLEATIYNSLWYAFREKLRELPPPPIGHYYFPVYDTVKLVNGDYEITMEIVLKPIISVEE